MNFRQATIAAVGLFIFLVAGIFIRAKLPKKLKVDKFINDWQELQLFCKDKTTWPHALSAADALLDKALKRRKFKGKSMGERLVNAQRTLTNNDGVWFAHNLCKKVIEKPATRLREADVKSALIGFRQALKDIGALPSGESKDS
ncbi:MAG: hypothetical protein AAB459_01345 [Patescibacteria group bacterium]